MNIAQNSKNQRFSSYKASHLFAITVSNVSVGKQHVFFGLESFCSKFLVSEEPHFNGNLHHHIYMRTYEKFRIQEIRRMIYEVYDIEQLSHEYTDEMRETDRTGVLVGTCRSERSQLKYITKYDSEPLFKGINDNELSFYRSVLVWAQSTEEFDITHPFVLNNPNYYKLLEQVHKRMKSKLCNRRLQPLRPLFNVNDRDNTNSWQKQVMDWWNDWTINGYRHKKKQLYLWGESNTGKTTFIHKLLKTCINSTSFESSINSNNELDNEYDYESQIFRPTPNDKRFAWQEFDLNQHNLVVIDEFDTNEYNLTDLKKLLAGECFTANRKGTTPIKICLKMPMILISNLPPPQYDNSSQVQGFLERLTVIKADKLILDFI